MYSVDDFFRIFDFLKNNPNLTEYEIKEENEEFIKLYKQLLFLQRLLDICTTFKFIYDNNIYTFDYALQQVKTTSYKIYSYITQDNTNDPNDIKNRNEEYIDYLNNEINNVEILLINKNINSGQNIDYFDVQIKSLAIDCRNETIKLFENVIDQIAFNTNDFLKLRRFIIDWYSALKTFLKLQRFSSDAFSLADNLLKEALKSFGFDNPEIFNSKTVKAALLLSLVNIYKRKGTPQSILDFLKFLNIKDAVIYEWWLHRYRYNQKIQQEINNGDLYLKAVKLGRFQQYEQDIHDFDRTLSWHEFNKELDGHWHYTEEEIKQLDSQLDYLSLPSILPYFSIAVFFNQEKVTSTIAFLNSIFNILYIKHLQSNINEDRIVHVNELDSDLNILEIYLGMLYAYHRYNDYVKYNELKNFIKFQYRIDPENYEPKPFIGEWPFKYEKLYHWAITTKDYDDQLITLQGFNLYPFNVEIYQDFQNINQNQNLDINFDNDELKTHFEFIHYIPYILNNNKSNLQRILSYRNIYENIYDIYDQNAYNELYEKEFVPLFEKIESYKDIHFIYETYDELLANKDNLPDNTVCIVRKDVNLDKYHKYQASLYKISNGNIERIENDEKYDYFKYLKDIDNFKQFHKEWTLFLKDNFSKNILDPIRLLTGELPTRIDHKYNLPTSGNNIDDLILVKQDETRYYLPSLYKCVSTIGSIDDQWKYVEDGLSKINMGINSDLITKIDDYTLNDENKYYEIAIILADYINIFTNTYIGDNEYNVKELLMGQANEIETILEAIKPYRARLFSYESINHLDNEMMDNIISLDVYNDQIIQRVPQYPLREPIRNNIIQNFDSDVSLQFDRPHVFDHIEIIDSDIYPCIVVYDDEIVYLENESVFERDIPIIGMTCGSDPTWQTTNVYHNNDKVMSESEEIVADIIV